MADQFNVQAQWLQQPGNVPSPVNQYLIQTGPTVDGVELPDSFIVTFGSTVPPMFPPNAAPSPEDMANIVAPIVPVAQLFFTTERLRELHSKLGELFVQIDEAGK